MKRAELEAEVARLRDEVAALRPPCAHPRRSFYKRVYPGNSIYPGHTRWGSNCPDCGEGRDSGSPIQDTPASLR